MKKTILSLLVIFITFNAHALRLGEKFKSAEMQSYLHLENCGAVKVHEQAFLTAAHCTHQDLTSNNLIRPLKAFSRTGHLKVMSSIGHKMNVRVSSVHYHPSYLDNASSCERRSDCIDMALVILDDQTINHAIFAKIPSGKIAEDELSYGQRIRFSGSGHESLIYKIGNFLGGIFNINNKEDQIPFDDQVLKEYTPKTYFINDFEIAIYPETISFFTREAPILLNGDSGAPLFNSNGEVIGINSHSDLLTGRSVAKKVHAKVAEPVLEWIEGTIQREGLWQGLTR